jgi:hypothetical protein
MFQHCLRVKQLHTFYVSPPKKRQKVLNLKIYVAIFYRHLYHIVRVNKYRRLRWVRCVAPHMEEMGTAYKIINRKNLKGRGYLSDLDKYWRIILKCILKKQVMMIWTGFIWLRAHQWALVNMAMNLQFP